MIAAAPSTKNKKRKRDSKMHQTRKGKQCHFGMKAHIGVYRDGKLEHTVVITAANVSDVAKTLDPLYGKETIKVAEKGKASIRAFVEHPFHIVKNFLKHRKVHYRRLVKNSHQMHILFGLANLIIADRRTLA